MSSQSKCPHTLRRACAFTFVLACLLVLAGHASSRPASARPPAQPTPTPSCTGCAVEPVAGVQPTRHATMQVGFNNAARNALGGSGPAYYTIARGTPPSVTQETVSDVRPLPHTLLRGIAWHVDGQVIHPLEAPHGQVIHPPHGQVIHPG